MGQGAFLTLVNGTPYDWDVVRRHSYQMPSWDEAFPSVKAGSTARVYVEFSQAIVQTTSDDAGEVLYQLRGTPYQFEVQARANGGFYLQVVLVAIASRGNPQGTTIRLGWTHNGSVQFVLTGKDGTFISNRSPTASWMADNFALLGSRTLRQVCMPGSHDAGMCAYTGGTAMGSAGNTVTQTVPIGGQLQVGSRYFDIRPVISGGRYATGHYSRIDLVSGSGPVQGGNGQSIDSIIDEVNAFTATNRELIVLRLSHSWNTDLDGLTIGYRPFTVGEWDALLDRLTLIRDRLVLNDAPRDVTRIPLNQLIGSRAAVIIVVDYDDNQKPTRLDGRNFFRTDQFPVYDDYSGTDDVNRMVTDQLQKMREQRPHPRAPFFVLSWTLTQQSTAAVAHGAVSSLASGVVGMVAAFEDTFNISTVNSPAPTAGTILDLARIASPSIYEKLLPQCRSRTFPNVLYMDDVAHPSITALAMAVNHVASTAPDIGHTLPAGEELTRDQSLRSANGLFKLVFQADGNLVIYERPTGQVVWATNTNCSAPGSLRLQQDGNLVASAQDGSVFWSSSNSGGRTGGQYTNSVLTLQDDGNLVIRAADRSGLWASNSVRPLPRVDTAPEIVGSTLLMGDYLTAGQALQSPDARYSAVYQWDGNFVVAQSDGAVRWASGVNSSTLRVVMQDDGNLVAYDAAGSPRWAASDHRGRIGPEFRNSRAVMQDDGNLVVYSANGEALWSSDATRQAEAPSAPIPQPPQPTSGKTAPAVPASATRADVGLSVMHAGRYLLPGDHLTSSDGRFTLRYQNDGNVVLYAQDNAVLWTTNTVGKPAHQLYLWGQGNLMVYQNPTSVLWDSAEVFGLSGPQYSGGYVRVQNDGNLEVRNQDGTLLWSSGSGNPPSRVAPPQPTPQPAPQTTASSGVNLALGRNATASSIEGGGLEPSNAVDGNPGTRWSSQYSDPQWICVDLGDAQTIVGVKLAWEAAFGRDYEIQVSQDNASWVTVATRRDGAGGTENHAFAPTNARFVRVHGTARGTPWGYSLWAFEVYGAAQPVPQPAPPPTPQTTASSGSNLALGRNATASSIEGGGLEPSNAVDGNPGTRWSSQYSDPQWICVDLGGAQTIVGVKLAWEAAFGRDYEIQVSQDNASWTTVATRRDGAGGTENHAFAPTNARFVRVHGTARGTPWGYSLWAFEVYGG